MSDPTLLVDIAAAGLAVRAKDGRLLVSPSAGITPSLRQRIAAGRDDLLAALEEQTPWDQSEADRLVADVLALYGGGHGESLDRIDSAYLASDMNELRRAARSLRAVAPLLAADPGWPPFQDGPTPLTTGVIHVQPRELLPQRPPLPRGADQATGGHAGRLEGRDEGSQVGAGETLRPPAGHDPGRDAAVRWQGVSDGRGRTE